MDAAKQKAIECIRRKISTLLSEARARRLYCGHAEIAEITGKLAAKCAPEFLFVPDCARVFIDLESHQLFAEWSADPNWADRRCTQLLSPEAFRQIAETAQLESVYTCMESQADWDAVFDPQLDADIHAAEAELMARQRMAPPLKLDVAAVLIPDDFRGSIPKMSLKHLQIASATGFSLSDVMIDRCGMVYRIRYHEWREGANLYVRQLTADEACWLEAEVEEAQNPGNGAPYPMPTLPGTLSVRIHSDGCEPVAEEYENPVGNFALLYHELCFLAMNGSKFE